MSDARSARRHVVWIVDDSPSEGLLTQHALGSDYEFERFYDGSTVVERLAAGGRQPDVVLLDWVMPGLSGDEVCRFLRAHPRTRDLPIILVTASRVETTDVVAGLASGANDYVPRPFAAEELRARVDSVIRAKINSDLAARERKRLATINKLGRALFEAGPNVDGILERLAATLTELTVDGCSVLLLPGEFPSVLVSRHRIPGADGLLAAISTVADPVVHAFDSSADAKAALPPAYHEYVARLGLRGLAIVPFPILAPVQGVVTVTRDGESDPFEPDDLALIETCIEYASLAVQNAMRFDTERIARGQLHAVLENLPVGIVVTDSAGTVTFSNSPAVRMIPGLSRVSVLSGIFELAQWTTPDGAPIDEPPWLSRPDGAVGHANRSEVVMRPSPASTPTTFVVSSVALRSGQGHVVGTVTVFDDVTAAHEIAAERERIAHFQQQLLGIVGHDLRNPLGAILVGTQVLRLHVDESSSGSPIIAHIESSATRIRRIVDQLLDVTRARLGNGIPVVRGEVDIGRVVKSVVDELVLLHPDARFEVVLPAGSVVGRWDPDRLAQVLSNLASNAVSYGRPDAPIRIEVSRSATEATITVKNAPRDKPIPPALLATLFDPYRRGGDDDRHTSGLGLGLYIVQQIVRAHGGTITAKSDPEGTTFRVVLPLVPSAAPA